MLWTSLDPRKGSNSWSRWIKSKWKWNQNDRKPLKKPQKDHKNKPEHPSLSEVLPDNLDCHYVNYVATRVFPELRLAFLLATRVCFGNSTGSDVKGKVLDWERRTLRNGGEKWKKN